MQPYIIDTHCHYNHKRLEGDLQGCLERAEQANVKKMIVVGYDLESSQKAVQLAESHPNTLFAVVGIHPHDSKDWNAQTSKSLQELLHRPCVVALGEIGLDFHHNFSPRSDQYVAFREQMELAHSANLPIVIHCREAYPETLQVLKEMEVSKLGGVMHCWAGSPQEAEQTIALGMALGFGGTLTYKNAENVREGKREKRHET